MYYSFTNKTQEVNVFLNNDKYICSFDIQRHRHGRIPNSVGCQLMRIAIEITSSLK